MYADKKRNIRTTKQQIEIEKKDIEYLYDVEYKGFQNDLMTPHYYMISMQQYTTDGSLCAYSQYLQSSRFQVR